MWSTRRRTKKVQAVYVKKLIILVCSGTVGLIVLGFALFFYFSFFFTPELLRPIPAQVQSATISVEQENIQEIQRKLYAADIESDEITHLPDGNYSIKLTENGEVILSQSRNISTQIASLQVIMQRLTMEGRRFAKLDLRFDKPVIVF